MPDLITTAVCLASCGVLAVGGWAETDRVAERHVKAAGHPTAARTVAAGTGESRG